MNEFVLAWVLVSSYYGLQYSPPVKTLEDCQRLQALALTSAPRTQCVQVNVLKKAQEK